MQTSENPATVLLVDDDPSHLKLYSWVVSRGGYRAVTALVGSSSVAFPKDRKVDIVLMDYRLSSELTAPDVARHIRREFPNVPILLISERIWMPDDMKTAVDAFVTKGDPQAMIEKIGELLASN
jgi:CheY-like chemotaxis protein